MTLDHLPPELRRTAKCGEFRQTHAGTNVVAMGWVARRRDLGSLIFIDLRDRAGVVQVVFNQETNAVLHKRAEDLRSEYVIAVEGKIIQRAAGTVNAGIPTGEVELIAERIYILNDARTPPFPIEDGVPTAEEARLRYRYIDLRRPRMQANLELRHRANFAVRSTLNDHGFLEIETPFMTRSTPEGARDYLVPSRVQPGTFYALPQSPQIFKQLLMVGGCDRYFQIVRCFRDEDLRADRQPEFTQIDLEMTYAQPELIYNVVEEMLVNLWKAGGYTIPRPFPRISYDEAMSQYGSDKPEMRLPRMFDAKPHFTAEDIQKLAIEPTLPFVAFRVPACGGLSRKERDELKPVATERGAKVFDDAKALEKHYPQAVAGLKKELEWTENDLLVLVGAPLGNGEAAPIAGPNPVNAVYTAAGALRLHAGQKYAAKHGLLRPDDFRFLWVLNFPMYEWDAEEKRFNAAHHPFTSPTDDTWEMLESNPGAVKAKAYDIVLNGTELGSGSIRIHRKDIQSRIFSSLGMSEEQAKQRFGFFLDALEYGTPPHGGIALGLDRIIMILAGENSIREVIAFPKTARAMDLMCEAPTTVSSTQLRELGIALKKDLS